MTQGQISRLSFASRVAAHTVPMSPRRNASRSDGERLSLLVDTAVCWPSSWSPPLRATPEGRRLSLGSFATCRLATSPSSFLRLPTSSFDGDGQDDCGVVIAPKAGPSPDVTPTLTVTGTANPATFYDMTARVGAASGGYAKP